MSDVQEVPVPDEDQTIEVTGNYMARVNFDADEFLEMLDSILP